MPQGELWDRTPIEPSAEFDWGDVYACAKSPTGVLPRSWSRNVYPWERYWGTGESALRFRQGTHDMSGDSHLFRESPDASR